MVWLTVSTYPMSILTICRRLGLIAGGLAAASLVGCGTGEPPPAAAPDQAAVETLPVVTASETPPVATAPETPPVETRPAESPEILKARARIAELKEQLAQNGDQFDWHLHNSLRDQYYNVGDDRKRVEQCDIILRHSIMDDYILMTMGAKDEDTARTVERMLAEVERYPEYRFVVAASRLQVAEFLGDDRRAHENLRKVAAMPGDDIAPYRELAEQRLASLPDQE